jgi:hypothetical protein
MKIINEQIDSNGLRIQNIEHKGFTWSILCNDRFEEGDFRAKFTCDICKPTYVPKVINYGGRYLCSSCLTNMIEMIQMATLTDCGKDRHERNNLEKILIAIENTKPKMEG